MLNRRLHAHRLNARANALSERLCFAGLDCSASVERLLDKRVSRAAKVAGLRPHASNGGVVLTRARKRATVMARKARGPVMINTIFGGLTRQEAEDIDF